MVTNPSSGCGARGASRPDSDGSITIDVIAGSFLPTFSQGFPTSHRIRPRYFAYLSAHALTPPASFINIFSCVGDTLHRATYRNARAHLLIVLLSTSIGTRAANDGSKWIRILVEGQLSKFKCVPQKLLGFSPYFEMFDDSEHGFQISVHGIASAAGLKYVPRMSELLQAVAEGDFPLFDI